MTTLKQEIEGALQYLSALVASNHLAKTDVGYQERRKVDDMRVEEATQAILSTISKYLPEKKPLFIGTCPLKGSCDGTRCKYEHEAGYEYYNLAIDEVNKLLTTNKKGSDG